MIGVETVRLAGSGYIVPEISLLLSQGRHRGSESRKARRAALGKSFLRGMTRLRNRLSAIPTHLHSPFSHEDTTHEMAYESSALRMARAVGTDHGSLLGFSDDLFYYYLSGINQHGKKRLALPSWFGPSSSKAQENAPSST